MKRILSLAASTLVAVTAAPAQAENRELGAHEHGHGALNIAVEGDVVLMELEAPGADIVGFEHIAETAEDRSAIDAAVAALAKPLALFTPEAAAGCVVTSASVKLVSEGGGHDEHDHDDGDEHDNHDHEEDDHGTHAKDGHDDHEEHAGDEGEGHTEFHAEYALLCADPTAIRTLSFAYFARFPSAEELEVQFISAKGAKGFEVERDEPRLDLGGAI